MTPNGSATISVSGNYSANAGDIVSYFYNFGINLDSPIPVSFTLQATANTPLGPITVSQNGAVLPGDNQYTGMGQSNPAPSVSMAHIPHHSLSISAPKRKRHLSSTAVWPTICFFPSRRMDFNSNSHRTQCRSPRPLFTLPSGSVRCF